ncbi:hypothetical protein [Ferrimonas marina]|uniref:Uncharacterized protein n=1 Tax=Ferrimonas marina TaxID=299255 RepID=A0A1M5Z5W3_9GAMM|nr:hypothetical protein [Ferrimonas marina]SHI19646.1 hypothetical protein SAMN02745129_4719 [Ferrimonas marina]
MQRKPLTFGTLLTAVLAIVSANGWAQHKPDGQYQSSQGKLTLQTLGEGYVTIKLKSNNCNVDHDGSRAMTFAPGGIHWLDEQGEPLLVIFFLQDQALVYGESPNFSQRYCQNGSDVTGTYQIQKP